MKTTISLKGHEYDSASAIIEKYGISYMTLYKWTKEGVLPHPVKLGRRNYYNRQAIENRLLGLN
jgi:predicted DNA-binding transcriptional regulator AlpA